MTLEEAGKTRCGGPRPEMTGVAALLPDPHGTRGSKMSITACSTTGCMNWRWLETTRTEAYREALVAHILATGESQNKAQTAVMLRRKEFAHTEGFCGLAGLEGAV